MKFYNELITISYITKKLNINNIDICSIQRDLKIEYIYFPLTESTHEENDIIIIIYITKNILKMF